MDINGKTSAWQMAVHFKVYREYLQENNLLDDSDNITLEDLAKFIEDNISDEEYELLADA